MSSTSMFIAMSAWREILARTLDGFEAQENVSPEWLVNPATQRRLKLDCYYPEAGLAIRFVGLTAKGQRRQSDWEVLETEQRDQTRAELCKRNGVQLVLIDPTRDPVKQMDAFVHGLSQTRRQANTSTSTDKRRPQRPLDAALAQARELRSRIARRPAQMMATLAESWRDRETSRVTALQDARASSPPANPCAGNSNSLPRADYSCGRRVRHARFGAGVITALDETGDDATVYIQFDNGESRTFLASLLQDKLFAA